MNFFKTPRSKLICISNCSIKIFKALEEHKGRFGRRGREGKGGEGKGKERKGGEGKGRERKGGEARKVSGGDDNEEFGRIGD
jgi:hypothetical protein